MTYIDEREKTKAFVAGRVTARGWWLGGWGGGEKAFGIRFKIHGSSLRLSVDTELIC